MADRQGVDLATRKTLVVILWSQSDGITSFRAAAAGHGLSMRNGERHSRPTASSYAAALLVTIVPKTNGNRLEESAGSA